MDGFSSLAEWANQNEGLLQALAMLGGIGDLLISLRRQQSHALARTKAVPAKVVVRPVAEGHRAEVISVLASYGGEAESDGEGISATFADADDAARAGLEVEAALSLEARVSAPRF